MSVFSAGAAMEDFSGYVQVGQMSRLQSSQIDALIGRRPQETPCHLTRVLYVPYHDQTTLHLPIYELQDWYHAAIGNTLMGSSLYTVKLSTIRKPCGDGTDAQVAYLVYFEDSLDEGQTVRVQHRVPVYTDADSDVLLKLPSSSDDKRCLITMQSPRSSHTVNIPMVTSFPIPPTVRQHCNIPHPYFTIHRPGSVDFAEPILEWQVHPIQDGALRYTLVQISKNNAPTNDAAAVASEIKAIYHHIGIGESLSQDHSEGILLLPEPIGRENSAWEGAVVASLLGMLSQLRAIPVDDKTKWTKSNTKTATKMRRWSLFKKGSPAVRRPSA